jgi:hypothetical protein
MTVEKIQKRDQCWRLREVARLKFKKEESICRKGEELSSLPKD